MEPKEVHDLLFKLFDCAEGMLYAPPIDYERGFIMMAYIEDYMDVYGRNLIFQTAKEAGLDAEESLQNAHDKLDNLRAALKDAFWEVPKSQERRTLMDEAARRLKKNYGTRE